MIKKYRKYIILILIVISFLSFIWGWNIINREEVLFIDVNNNNKEIIVEDLKKVGVRTLGVRKIGIGSGWHKDSIYVHYYFGKAEEIYCGEGDSYFDRVSNDDIYSLDNKPTIVCGISILILVTIFIYEVKRRNL